MSKNMTLGQLIAEADFNSREAHNAIWSISANEIEELLYNRSYGSYSLQAKHEQAFDAHEKLVRVSINTWICTDELVGLELLVLNGTAVGAIWRSGRKDTIDISLLSAEARNLLIDAWERHRPEGGNDLNLVDADMLNMPVAAPGEKPFDVDASAASNASLSAYGVAQWMESLKDEGGLASVNELAPLQHAEKVLLHKISRDEESLKRFREYLASKTEDLASYEDQHLKELTTTLDIMQNQMLPEIQARLKEIA